jgi:hypothetical protein
MRRYLCGLAGLALLVFASPAFAEMQSFTLGGHQFHFDISPEYVEDKALSAETKKFLRRLRMYLSFQVRYETMNEAFDRLKDNPRWKSEYLFDGHVGYQIAICPDKGCVLGAVFTTSCSGRCVISVSVGGPAGDGPPPFSLPEAQALLEKYARVLASGNFGGE